MSAAPSAACPAAVGVLGGTFDPVHNGHLRCALELRERLGLSEVRLMPAARPPHRAAPECPAAERAALVELAVAGEDGLTCDRRELRRAGPSYTVDSLLELRAELGPNTPICLLLGADAAAGLDRWHRWRELPGLAHLVIIPRPGWAMPRRGPAAEFLRPLLTRSPGDLLRAPCGRALLAQTSPMDISSSAIRGAIRGANRGQLRNRQSPHHLLPDAVWERIRALGLYGASVTHPAAPAPPSQARVAS